MQWMEDDDVFILDRGFRDVIDDLEEGGLDCKMPAYLGKGFTQRRRIKLFKNNYQS